MSFEIFFFTVTVVPYLYYADNYILFIIKRRERHHLITVEKA